jgi:hypothetical protein
MKRSLLFVCVLFLLVGVTSCRKDSTGTQQDASSVKLGLYETVSDHGQRVLMGITKLGTKPVDYKLIFDTGSGGMVLDAHDILPSLMITSSGFSFQGDSTVVNGITITNKQAVIQYGNDNSSVIKVYGNLAYASVTIGAYDGSVQIKRLPFFIYYKSVDAKGNQSPNHEYDVMGVSSGYGVKFANGEHITSPFAYYNPGNGLTSGFKIANLSKSFFKTHGVYMSGVVTVGLSKADLESSGFTMTQLYSSGSNGYLPYVRSKITYMNKIVVTNVIFDTGTQPYSYIQDGTALQSLSALPQNSQVSVVLDSGYSYEYTTGSDANLTNVVNPDTSGAWVSIIGLDFFFRSEYLIDFTNHQIGLKND